jgi:hypothetical protein
LVGIEYTFIFHIDGREKLIAVVLESWSEKYMPTNSTMEKVHAKAHTKFVGKNLLHPIV